MIHTDEVLIHKYIELRAKVKAMETAFAETLSPIKGAMDVIGNEMLRRLNERGADSSKTDAGTAYISELTSVKVGDKEAFRAYVLENDFLDMVSLDPIKEQIVEYMGRSGGNPPPGVVINRFKKTNFRSA